MMRMKLLVTTLALAFGMVSSSAFATEGAHVDGGTKHVSQAQGNVVSITANTMATIDDVLIGAYNIRDEDFKDDKGAAATRLSAALQIAVKGDPSKEQKMRVHTGQTFAVGSKSFEVKAVSAREVQLLVK